VPTKVAIVSIEVTCKCGEIVPAPNGSLFWMVCEIHDQQVTCPFCDAVNRVPKRFL